MDTGLSLGFVPIISAIQRIISFISSKSSLYSYSYSESISLHSFILNIKNGLFIHKELYSYYSTNITKMQAFQPAFFNIHLIFEFKQIIFFSLHTVHFSIFSVKGHKSIMRTYFHDFTVIKHIYSVCHLSC